MENVNIRIAKELNKIARELVAGGQVANQPGEYKHFTGTIDWRSARGQVKGQVKNATFILYKNGEIIWKDGIWENGTLQNGAWEGGIWLNGTWKYGRWIKGTWKGGTWIKGIDKHWEKHDKGDSPDKWGK